jgi:hypothetical protein
MAVVSIELCIDSDHHAFQCIKYHASPARPTLLTHINKSYSKNLGNVLFKLLFRHRHIMPHTRVYCEKFSSDGFLTFVTSPIGT